MCRRHYACFACAYAQDSIIFFDWLILTQNTQEIWQQSTLPAKRGGLSIADPSRNHVPAYLATYISGTFSKLRSEEELKKSTSRHQSMQQTLKERIFLFMSCRCTNFIKTLLFKACTKLEKLKLTFEDIAAQARPQSYLSSFLHNWNDDCIRATWSRTRGDHPPRLLLSWRGNNNYCNPQQ